MTTEEAIRVRIKNRWGAVPVGLVEDKRLGPTARLIGVWLCVLPPKWIVRKHHLLTTLGFGEDAYLAARRQLITAGYLVAGQARTEGGTFGSAQYEFDCQPQAVTAAPGISRCGEGTAPGLTGRGSTAPGQPRPLPLPQSPIPELPPLPPPPPDVVVVDWPSTLTAAQVEGCLSELAQVTGGQRQMVVDELAGSLVAGRCIRNPVGWVRAVAKKLAVGQVTWDFAPAIAAERAALAERATKPPPSPPSPAPADPAVRAAGLAKLVQLRRSFRSH